MALDYYDADAADGGMLGSGRLKVYKKHIPERIWQWPGTEVNPKHTYISVYGICIIVPVAYSVDSLYSLLPFNKLELKLINSTSISGCSAAYIFGIFMRFMLALCFCLAAWSIHCIKHMC